MAVRQAVAEVGDGGVIAGELAPDGQSLLVLRFCIGRPARRGEDVANVNVVARQAVAEADDGGVVTGQFPMIASAARYSASALAGRPVVESRTPRLPWVTARRSRKSVTAGLSLASLPWIARAARYSASASAARPVV